MIVSGRIPVARMLIVCACSVLLGSTPTARGSRMPEASSGAIAAAPTAVAAASSAPSVPQAWSSSALASLDRHVLDLALDASRCAVSGGAVANPGTLTIIDYSKPSTESRLWVLDLQTHSVLFNELVAHGQGTGDNLAVEFSNTPDSHKSSLGLFVTEDPYVGKHGYSLRLNGLDRGFNDRARERAIVLHGAPYVSEQFSKSAGRLGRSWGCPAVREIVARKLIDRVKGGSLVFAYYPDQEWLQSSQFLHGCSVN